VAGKFLGRFEHSLDSKGRIVLPAKFRAHFETRLFLTEHLDKCVALWTPEEFEEELTKKAQMQSLSRADRNRVRVWASGATEAEIDRSGRVAIPTWLRTYAGLEEGEEVLIMGAIERVELWRRVEWETRIQPSEDEIANPPDGALIQAPSLAAT
jgi:MraZ protein